MVKETEAMKENKSLELMNLPEIRTNIGWTCVFKKQTNADTGDEKFKSKLFIQGFSRKYDVHYAEESRIQLREQHCNIDQSK